MSRPAFPLAAILPDLWTVYERGRPVSQHATLKLAVAHVAVRIDSGLGLQAHYDVAQPEHSLSAVQLARAAIRKAQLDSRSCP